MELSSIDIVVMISDVRRHLKRGENMSLILRDPFKELEQFQQRMTEIFQGSPSDSIEGVIPVNVFEQNNMLKVEAELPRFKPEEVEVNLTKDRVEITAEHSDESEEKSKKYYHREAKYTRLYRQVGLPKGVNVDKAKAINKDGVLTIEMPLSEAIEPKKLEVESGES